MNKGILKHYKKYAPNYAPSLMDVWLCPMLMMLPVIALTRIPLKDSPV
jgi:hypothetical protein